ncbi:MAG: hypothetical protein QG629_73 [Patescibacteria group bacterium]|nr:hypothetical protein [Candidatus Saccharibacteria bacterium]MDQ5962991.1 hypothetical protein [Patescibacteria group bacterium]
MVKSQKGFTAIEGLLVIILVGILGFTGWFVWNSQRQTNKTTEQTVTSGFVAKKKTAITKPVETAINTTDENYLEIKEWGVKLLLNDEIKKSNLSYVFKKGTSDISQSDSSISLSNSEDPLVKDCKYVTQNIVRLTKAQASYVAPGSIAKYGANENYGAKAVINDFYYVPSGPQQACNGDYSMFKNAQHNAIKDIIKL